MAASSQVALDVVQLATEPVEDGVRGRIVAGLNILRWLHDLQAAGGPDQCFNLSNQVIGLIE